MTHLLPSIKSIYEDEFIFALSKGACVHSVKGEGISLADALEVERPMFCEASPNKSDAGLVTRLDFETSGVILGAKTREAWEKLRDLSRRHQIEKRYEIIVEGKAPKAFSVTAAIGAKGRSSKKVKAFLTPPSKSFRALPAITNFSLISYSEKLDASFLQASSRFGRRHQIRVHSALKGFPLIGDTLYGSKKVLPKDFLRPFFLHAESVSFTHPFTKKMVVISDPSLLKEGLGKDLFS